MPNPLLPIRSISVIRGCCFSLVYLDPAIQVKTDPLVSVVAQFFIKGLEFGLLFDELVPSPSFFFAVACGGAYK